LVGILLFSIFGIRGEGSGVVDFNWSFNWFLLGIDKVVDSDMDNVAVDSTDESIIHLLLVLLSVRLDICPRFFLLLFLIALQN
jgi:hypothetical protein